MSGLANTTESNERLLSLFAHISHFLGGIIIPIIFWAVNKDKSKFVTFHSLQALWFHISLSTLNLGIGIFLGGFFGILTGIYKHNHRNSNDPYLVTALAIFFAFFIFSFISAGAYSIYMGIKAYHGELKKYPIIGKMVYKRVYGNV